MGSGVLARPRGATAHGVWAAIRQARSLGALILAALAMAVFARPAAAAVFVDATLGDVKPEQRVVIAHPQPVQLFFQFRTKGSPNAKATKLLQPDVLAAVKASGLFSDVSDGPAANGAILNVVIDDVVTPEDMKAAVGQGVATGLTMGVAGSTVREHYAATLDYMSGPGAPKITRDAQHFVLMQMGLIHGGAPENAVKVDGGIKAAVSVMARQIVSNPLNAIGGDPAFAPPAPAAVAPADPAQAPTPAQPADPAQPAATPTPAVAAAPTEARP